MAPDDEIEELRLLLYQFEESAVWAYVQGELSRAHDQDVELLLSGTERDERVRGGIALAKDMLAIPDRLRLRIKELEEKRETSK